MLRVIDLYNYLSTNLPYDNYYINELPSTSPDRTAVVKINPGAPPSDWTQKKKPSFQVLIRGGSKDDSLVEQKAYEIYQHFHNKAEFKIGTTRIVHCSANQSAPLFIGKDESNRPIYSVNFTCTTMST